MSDEREYNRRSFRQEDIERLKQLITEGVNVKQEIDDLNQGLKDTVKAIAEEMEIKPSQLNKAITIAFRNSLDEEREKMDEIEDILDIAGRK